jgi:hypothetical protein
MHGESATACAAACYHRDTHLIDCLIWGRVQKATDSNALACQYRTPTNQQKKYVHSSLEEGDICFGAQTSSQASRAAELNSHVHRWPPSGPLSGMKSTPGRYIMKFAPACAMKPVLESPSLDSKLDDAFRRRALKAAHPVGESHL